VQMLFLVSAIFLLGVKTGALARLLPCLDLAPRTFAFCLQLIIAGTELSDSLFGEELLQGPLLDVLGLVLLELCDEGYGALEDRPLVLFASRNNLG